MTVFDLVFIGLVVVYVLLSVVTGLVRRVIGITTVYLASVVATFMGPQGGAIYQQAVAATPTPDATLIGWLFFFFLIVVVVEFMATLVHQSLQLSVVALNRLTGVVVGLVTATVVTVVLFFMLAGFAQPLGGGDHLDSLQISARDSLTRSTIGFPVVRASGPTILPLLQAALPRDPKEYFGSIR